MAKLKPEQKIKRKLTKALAAIPDIGYELVELRTGKAGFPDIIINAAGVGFIEVKYMYKFGDLSEWTRDQRRWAKKWRPAAPIWVFIGNEECSFLFDAADIWDDDSFDPEAAIVQFGTRVKPFILKQILINT